MAEAVARAADCQDVARIGRVPLDLGAQPVDVGVDIVLVPSNVVPQTASRSCMRLNTRPGLRAKIERDPADPRYVLTVRGAGYRFSHPQ